MSKLDELGGLEAAKEVADNPAEFLRSYVRGTIQALVEHVESLTSERDALKKRVEELAQALQKERERLAAYSQVHLRKVSQLQAARELAESVLAIHHGKGAATLVPVTKCNLYHARDRAREFLKLIGPVTTR